MTMNTRNSSSIFWINSCSLTWTPVFPGTALACRLSHGVLIGDCRSGQTSPQDCRELDWFMLHTGQPLPVLGTTWTRLIIGCIVFCIFDFALHAKESHKLRTGIARTLSKKMFGAPNTHVKILISSFFLFFYFFNPQCRREQSCESYVSYKLSLANSKLLLEYIWPLFFYLCMCTGVD